jgi:hypothetical protein
MAVSAMLRLHEYNSGRIVLCAVNDFWLVFAHDSVFADRASSALCELMATA